MNISRPDTFIDDLQEIMLETLESLVETMADGECRASTTGDPGLVLEAQVPIVGEMEGVITVRAIESVALGLAAIWAGCEPEELETQDALDTMSEFCNVFGGTAKTVLPDATSLDMPSVRAAPAKDFEPLSDSVSVSHDLGILEVQLKV